MKVTVLGSGSWGTALALVLVENGHDVSLWSHRKETAEKFAGKAKEAILKGYTFSMVSYSLYAIFLLK